MLNCICKFSNARQSEGETLQKFLSKFQRLRAEADLNNLNSKEILDLWETSIIVLGLKNTSLSTKIQLMDKISLNDARKLIITSEAIKNQITEVNSFKTAMQPEVAFVNKKAHKAERLCLRCGKENYSKEHKCPAFKVVYSSCRYKGYFPKFCENVSQGKLKKFAKNSNKYHKQNKVNNGEHLEESSEFFFFESISMASTTASNLKSTNKTWSFTGILKNTRNNSQLPVDFKVDSGSCVTAIPEKLYSD